MYTLEHTPSDFPTPSLTGQLLQDIGAIDQARGYLREQHFQSTHHQYGDGEWSSGQVRGTTFLQSGAVDEVVGSDSY